MDPALMLLLLPLLSFRCRAQRSGAPSLEPGSSSWEGRMLQGLLRCGQRLPCSHGMGMLQHSVRQVHFHPY